MTTVRRSITLKVSSNLIISAAGAGILSFPYAMKQAGLVLGIFFCLFFGYLNALALQILSDHSGKGWNMKQQNAALLTSNKLSPPSSYRQLMKVRLGETAGRIASFSIYFGIFGALIGFLIIIAELTCPVLQQWFSDTLFIVKRPVVIIIFVVFIAMPLSTLKNLKSLAFSSVLAIVSVLYVVFLVTYRQVVSSSPPCHQWLPSSRWSTFEALPIMLFAFGCPLQTVTSVHELADLDPSHSAAVMKTAVVVTMCTCGWMYISVGLFGFLDFGQDTDGIILNNYSKNDFVANVGRVLMALHVALAYPVIFNPAQSGLVYWWTQKGSRREDLYVGDDDESPSSRLLEGSAGGEVTGEEGGAADGGAVDLPLLLAAPLHVRVCTAVMVGVVTAAAAICVPQVQMVFG